MAEEKPTKSVELTHEEQRNVYAACRLVAMMFSEMQPEDAKVLTTVAEKLQAINQLQLKEIPVFVVTDGPFSLTDEEDEEMRQEVENLLATPKGNA